MIVPSLLILMPREKASVVKWLSPARMHFSDDSSRIARVTCEVFEILSALQMLFCSERRRRIRDRTEGVK